jgi:hypothetical protein
MPLLLVMPAGGVQVKVAPSCGGLQVEVGGQEEPELQRTVKRTQQWHEYWVNTRRAHAWTAPAQDSPETLNRFNWSAEGGLAVMLLLAA